MLASIGVHPGELVRMNIGRDEAGQEAIFLEKYYNTCLICTETLISGKFKELNNRRICLDCFEELQNTPQ